MLTQCSREYVQLTVLDSSYLFVRRPNEVASYLGVGTVGVQLRTLVFFVLS